MEETQLQSVQSGGELISPPISFELVAPKPQTEPQPEEQPELEDEKIPYEEVPFEEDLEPVQHDRRRVLGLAGGQLARRYALLAFIERAMFKDDLFLRLN